MPNTRLQGEELEQLIDEVKSYIILRHQIKEFCSKYNIPDLNIPEPVMAENPNRPLRDYVAPSQEETHNNIASSAIE